MWTQTGDVDSEGQQLALIPELGGVSKGFVASSGWLLNFGTAPAALQSRPHGEAGSATGSQR
jgi:hypothetical protein